MVALPFLILPQFRLFIDKWLFGMVKWDGFVCLRFTSRREVAIVGVGAPSIFPAWFRKASLTCLIGASHRIEVAAPDIVMLLARLPCLRG